MILGGEGMRRGWLGGKRRGKQRWQPCVCVAVLRLWLLHCPEWQGRVCAGAAFHLGGAWGEDPNPEEAVQEEAME